MTDLTALWSVLHPFHLDKASLHPQLRKRRLYPPLMALCLGRAGELHVGDCLHGLPHLLGLLLLLLLLLPLLRRGGERSTGLIDRRALSSWISSGQRSQQDTVLAELLRTTPSAPLEQQGVTNAEWQQDDLLSIAASEEMGDQEFPSEEGDSDSTTPVVHLFLSADLMPLIKRATEPYRFHGL
ncbi:UNVERIFIED_CONTAM: hypothetical protein FKN15_032243 [Acipenser sinensis]